MNLRKSEDQFLFVAVTGRLMLFFSFGIIVLMNFFPVVRYILFTLFGLIILGILVSILEEPMKKVTEYSNAAPIEKGILNIIGTIVFYFASLGMVVCLIGMTSGIAAILIGVAMYYRWYKIFNHSLQPGFGLGIMMYIALALGIYWTGLAIIESSVLFFFLAAGIWSFYIIKLKDHTKCMKIAAPGLLFIVTAGIGALLMNFRSSNSADPSAIAATPDVSSTGDLTSIGNIDTSPIDNAMASTAMQVDPATSIPDVSSATIPDASSTDISFVTGMEETAADPSVSASSGSIDIQDNARNTVLHVDSQGNMFDSSNAYAGNISTDSAGTTVMTDRNSVVSTETGNIVTGADGRIEGVIQTNIDGSTSVIDPHTGKAVDIGADGTISTGGTVQGKIVKND